MQQHFRSIMASIRIVPNVCVGDMSRKHMVFSGSSKDYAISLTFLTEIFREYGTNFKRVEFRNCIISIRNLKMLLTFTPNMESLLLQSCQEIPDRLPGSARRVNSNKLNELTLDCCWDLQNVALSFTYDTITKFKLLTEDAAFLSAFLSKQKNIHHLSLHIKNEIKPPRVLLNGLVVKELSLGVNGYAGNNVYIQLVTVNQAPNLRFVDLTVSRVTDDIFLSLVSAKELHTLKVIVNEVSIQAFKIIEKFHKLEELTLIKNDNDVHKKHLEVVSQVVNLNLKKIEIFYPCMTIDRLSETIVEIAHNSPNLTHLAIDSNISAVLIFSIANTMRKLKSLKLTDPQEFKLSPEETVFFYNYYNPNYEMRELSLNFKAFDGFSFLLSIAKRFPNVSKLTVCTILSESYLEKLVIIIFSEFKQLRELNLLNEVDALISPTLCHAFKSVAFRMKQIDINVSTNKQTKSLSQYFGGRFSIVKISGSHLQLYN